ncbi:MAG: cytochrome c3 family protein, partial [Myxococcota bacterium]
PGKPPNHLPTSADCVDCHSTLAFSPATFDHSGITGNCVSCHNGSTAPGKPPNHLPTSADCVDCHSTGAFLPASFDHTGITGNCSSCHNGSTATGKPSQHFVTSLDCSSCHTPARWTQDVFQHTSPNYPGNHSGNPNCTRCHQGNSSTVNWSQPAYRPDCAGCHARDFESEEHPKTRSPTTRYTAGELRDCAGACHIYTDQSLSTIQQRRNSNHRARDGDWD